MLVGARRALLNRRPGYSLQAQQFFARLATQPTKARKDYYAAVIDALVASGLWTWLDALYLLAAVDTATALTNLISANYTATTTGGPTFTVDQGFAGDTSKNVDSNFNPSTAGGLFQQNDASVFGWSLTTGQKSGQVAGMSAAARTSIYSRYTDNLLYCRINSGTDDTEPSTDGSGLWSLSRLNAAGFDIYRNGTSFAATKVKASVGLTNGNIIFAGNDGPSSLVACAGIGRGRSAAQELALYNALYPYMHAVAGVA